MDKDDLALRGYGKRMNVLFGLIRALSLYQCRGRDVFIGNTPPLQSIAYLYLLDRVAMRCDHHLLPPPHVAKDSHNLTINPFFIPRHMVLYKLSRCTIRLRYKSSHGDRLAFERFSAETRFFAKRVCIDVGILW